MGEPRIPARGEIWICDFSPSRGSEQAGTRPALIIQNVFGNRNPRYPNTVVLAMSTKGKPVPFHVRIDPAAVNGLEEVTFVKCEQVLTISKARLLGSAPIGRIAVGQLRAVETALKLSLGLP